MICLEHFAQADDITLPQPLRHTSNLVRRIVEQVELDEANSVKPIVQALDRTCALSVSKQGGDGAKKPGRLKLRGAVKHRRGPERR